MIKGNKGEWSEYYAFLKLLAERRLDFGGPGFKKLDTEHYSILKIIRTENGDIKSYEFGSKDSIGISTNGSVVKSIMVEDLKTSIRNIFEVIVGDSDGSFPIKIADKLMKRLGSTSLNAGNQLKEDIVLKIHDHITGLQPEIGFSIKSMIGGAATLLNASGATNFTYEIVDLDKSKIGCINEIDTPSKIRDRLESIKNNGGILVYSQMDSEIFEANLRLCDTIMPEILAQMLLFYNSGRGNTFEGLVDQMVMSKFKIHGFLIDRIGYEHKIQNLLYAVALGMVPNSRWDGFMRAYGGYIIVREDGELVGYNVYNADIFRKYLLRTTKFETASSSRHGFGRIYEKNGKLFIKLNLQIRFIK